MRLIYYVTWLDGFCRTLPGIVILGRILAYRDIAAYWMAIGIVASID